MIVLKFFMWLFFNEVNFCSTCKYYSNKTYCKHKHFAKVDHITGQSWAPMAENVRSRDHTCCFYWEEKCE